MSLSREEVLDAIAEMSVMDVVQLVEAMEEKFGVSAAAAVAAAPAGLPAAGSASVVRSVWPSVSWRPGAMRICPEVFPVKVFEKMDLLVLA